MKVRLTEKGVAVGKFLAEDSKELGLADGQVMTAAMELSDAWDGTQSLIEMFHERFEVKDGQVVDKWPETIG